MEVTVKSWGENQGLVFLMERHDDVFYSADYDIYPLYGDRYSSNHYQGGLQWYQGFCDNTLDSGVDVDLFRPGIFSGSGTLLKGGRFLKIIVEDFQRDFALETNGFEKTYYYDSRSPEIKYPSTLVWSNDFNFPYQDTEDWDRFSSALVLLREDDSWPLRRGSYLGKLFNSTREIIAYLPGVSFEAIESYDFVEMGGNCGNITSYPIYRKGGVIFTEILWIGSPQVGNFNFIVDGAFSGMVYVDGETISYPTPEVYNIDWSGVRFLEGATVNGKYQGDYIPILSSNRYIA